MLPHAESLKVPFLRTLPCPFGMAVADLNFAGTGNVSCDLDLRVSGCDLDLKIKVIGKKTFILA